MTVNNAVLNMSLQAPVWDFAFNSLDIYSKVELLDQILILFLSFCDTITLFYTAAAPFHISINNAHRFQCLHILNDICYFLISLSPHQSSHPNGCKRIQFHDGVHLHFPNDMLGSFSHVLTDQLLSYRNMSMQVLWPF